MERRSFIKYCMAAAGVGLCPWPMVSAWAEDTAPKSGKQTKPGASLDDSRFVREAMFYKTLDNGDVQCLLCPNQCEVSDGERGECGVRENRSGKYYTLVYGRAVAVHNDPIEKKPFYHFRPGTMVLSVAAAGCNIHCKFCQNWQISQFRPEEVSAQYLPPEKIVRLAVENNIPNVAFTYAEPTIFYEYMYETAKLAKAAGINPVVVSNGFISPEAVKKLAPHLSAYKVDLKAFTEVYYRDICSARLQPVLDTLKTLAGTGVWVEIVNLVLPTLNDNEKDVRAMARWIGKNLGPDTPVHFTRFYPMYKMRNLPPTPVSTLENLHTWATEEGLRYAYIGNVPGHPDGNTVCRSCGHMLIRRTGMWDVEVRVKNGGCPECGNKVPGVWS
jgi:pyruvate formate lyase activating enzyme